LSLCVVEFVAKVGFEGLPPFLCRRRRHDLQNCGGNSRGAIAVDFDAVVHGCRSCSIESARQPNLRSNIFSAARNP
jgi:hypothetical protein